MNGAGGTNGGLNRFFIGFIMLVGGGYLLLNAIHVDNHFGMGQRLYTVGNVGITSGFIMIPFMFGIGMLFFNARNLIGWLLTFGSLVMLIFGVITSIDFRLQSMTAFELISILVLLVGGLGLMLSSFRSYSN